MTLSDHTAAYIYALHALVARNDLFGAIDALIARDSLSRWWTDANEC